jgi:hypothetical protein
MPEERGHSSVFAGVMASEAELRIAMGAKYDSEGDLTASYT